MPCLPLPFGSFSFGVDRLRRSGSPLRSFEPATDVHGDGGSNMDLKYCSLSRRAGVGLVGSSMDLEYCSVSRAGVGLFEGLVGGLFERLDGNLCGAPFEVFSEAVSEVLEARLFAGRDGSVFDDLTTVRPQKVLLESHTSLRTKAGDMIRQFAVSRCCDSSEKTRTSHDAMYLTRRTERAKQH